MADKRRSEDRTSLRIPMRIMGFNRDGTSWEEITSSGDLSKRGVSCPLKHKISKGNVVLMTCAMPKPYRTHDLNEASYRVYALVRSVGHDKSGAFRVGMLFLGRNPPRDFTTAPWTIYLMPGDQPPDRRRQPRYAVFVTLRLTRLNEDSAAGRELTVAEDLGPGGARVPTSLPVSKGEIVLVEEVGGDFSTQAEVRNTFVGQDHVARLNLKFLDARVPARLLP
jgi:hypothetical protein